MPVGRLPSRLHGDFCWPAFGAGHCAVRHNLSGSLRCIVNVMSEERPSDNIKARTEALIEIVEAAVGDIVSPRTRETLTDAITQDLAAANDQAMLDRERLAKVESQTRVLADAVIAIADTGPSVAVAPAVKAVKAEIKASSASTPAPGQYFDGRGND